MARREVTVQAIVASMRCRACRAPSARMHLASNRGGGWLCGNGSGSRSRRRGDLALVVVGEPLLDAAGPHEPPVLHHHGAITEPADEIDRMGGEHQDAGLLDELIEALVGL